MYEILYERLRMFRLVADEHIDFDFHKFEYEGKTYTQKELMDILDKKLYTAITFESLDYENNLEEANKVFESFQDIWLIWSILTPYMWW